jgi:hypothetical protein
METGDVETDDMDNSQPSSENGFVGSEESGDSEEDAEDNAEGELSESESGDGDDDNSEDQRYADYINVDEIEEQEDGEEEEVFIKDEAFIKDEIYIKEEGDMIVPDDDGKGKQVDQDQDDARDWDKGRAKKYALWVSSYSGIVLAYG